MRKSAFVVAFLVALTLLATSSFAETYECTRALPYTVNGIVKPANQTIIGDLHVPAGKTCQLNWITVTGNVIVEGTLTAVSSTFLQNVTVFGGQISIINGVGPVVGNLTIIGSPYYNQISCPNSTNVIGGNLTVVGNSGPFYVCQAAVGSLDANNNVVGGNVVVSNNAGRVDIGGIAALGTLACSGNAQLVPSHPSAAQKLDQCSGF